MNPESAGVLNFPHLISHAVKTLGSPGALGTLGILISVKVNVILMQNKFFKRVFSLAYIRK